MKVILKEDIVNLGYKDDVVEVKDGYGRNYLIPQKKAVIASESALKVLAENQVIAIEPKFVIPHVGAVGIEDTYVVTPDGLQAITQAPVDIFPLF